MGGFIGGFSIFLHVQIALLADFMELYMLLNKLKRWVLLVYGLNAILPWFVLHLLLGLMFLGCFVIGGTHVLIIARKLGLGFLTIFVKEILVLISLLT